MDKNHYYVLGTECIISLMNLFLDVVIVVCYEIELVIWQSKSVQWAIYGHDLSSN
jgi:hypothetical protein